MAYIGLLDCNNFFVSCERLFRPDLWGKPVVVLSSNDGCIVARSQEVKDMNVPMGVPYFQVKDTLKQAGTSVFSSHFALYRDVSRRVMSVLRDELAAVEQYSVDEAFFSCKDDFEATAWRVKTAVERRVGVPVSVGLATSKTLAKFANSVAKKSTGVFVLDDTAWQERCSTVPVAAIWGIGGRLEQRLKQHGLVTAADLITADPARIARLFGVNGARLQQELAGQAIHPLTAVREPQKTIMSSRSFRDAVTELSVIEDAVAYHVRHATADLRAMGHRAQGIRVSIRPSRHGDYVLRGGAAEAILTLPSNDTSDFLRLGTELVGRLYEAGVPYKKAGIILSSFSPDGGPPATLFPDRATRDLGPMLASIDGLNDRYGRELITMGSRLQTGKWQSRVDARSPAYTTRWTDIARVSAT